MKHLRILPALLVVAAALPMAAVQPGRAAAGTRTCPAGMTSGGVVTPAGGHLL